MLLYPIVVFSLFTCFFAEPTDDFSGELNTLKSRPELKKALLKLHKRMLSTKEKFKEESDEFSKEVKNEVTAENKKLSIIHHSLDSSKFR
jgi:hypothetical protein